MEVSISVGNPILMAYLIGIPLFWSAFILNYDYLSPGDTQIELAHAIFWPLAVAGAVFWRFPLWLLKMWKK
jgi:hypothetical protein